MQNLRSDSCPVTAHDKWKLQFCATMETTFLKNRHFTRPYFTHYAADQKHPSSWVVFDVVLQHVSCIEIEA